MAIHDMLNRTSAKGAAISTGDGSCCSGGNRKFQPWKRLQQRALINRTYYSVRWTFRLMFTNLGQQTLDVWM
jgi:hypothetical protein